MKIREAVENYLEKIYIEIHKKGKVRQADICSAMHYSRPTVSIMLRDLRDKGYIHIDEKGFLSLTEKGTEIAGRVFERHCIIADVLMFWGVTEETAMEDACKIEHDISDESFESIRKYYQNIKKCNHTDKMQ
jgi:Mn-dependent DtxR family transcriptional regulator